MDSADTVVELSKQFDAEGLHRAVGRGLALRRVLGRLGVGAVARADLHLEGVHEFLVVDQLRHHVHLLHGHHIGERIGFSVEHRRRFKCGVADVPDRTLHQEARKDFPHGPHDQASVLGSRAKRRKPGVNQS